MGQMVGRNWFGRSLLAAAFSLLLIAVISVRIGEAADTRISLTPDEQAWLDDHRVIRVANEDDWPPFDFSIDGQANGISIDYMNLIADRLGIVVEYVNGYSWSELQQMVRERKLDVLTSIVRTEEREEFLHFTIPYVENPSVIIVRDDAKGIRGIGDLDGKTLAAVKDYYVETIIKKRYPGIAIHHVAGVVDGLKAVSLGKADAYIGSLAVAGYEIQQNVISNLRIAGQTGDPDLDLHDLSFGVREDWPELVPILNKAVASLTAKETRAIRDRWIPLEGSLTSADRSSSDNLVWWILAIAGGVVVGLIVLGRFLDRPVDEAEIERLSSSRRFLLAMTFSNLRISAKVLFVLVLVATASAGSFGILEYFEARKALRAEAFSKLTAVREMKAQQIEDYFETITNQVVTFSESRTVIEAMQAFKKAFAAMEPNGEAGQGREEPIDPELVAYYRNEFFARLEQNTIYELEGITGLDFIPKAARARYLQGLFISRNPHPAGEKHKLETAEDGGAYSAVHKAFHPIIRSYLEKFGYYDIFLIDHETGDIIYSVFKEVDFATSLLTGPYKGTNFAKAFRAARNARDGQFIRMVDYEPYYPSYRAPASFIASPIFHEGEMIGVLAFQMPIGRINTIMTSHQSWKEVGLGESGETYIVGGDLTMRNQSRFLIEDRDNYLDMIRTIGLAEETVHSIEAFGSSIGLQRVETKGTRAALAGRTNTEVFPDYRGIPVLSSYRPLGLLDMRWVIMSEIDEAEAMAAAEALRVRMLILMGVILLAILGVSFIFAKTMTRPIKILTAKAEALAEGDLGISIDVKGGDEIANLARSFDVMRKALRELVGNLEAKVTERTQELQDSETRIRTIIENAADGIIVINENGIIQSFSPAAEAIFGYVSNEVVGKSVNMLMPKTVQSEHDGYLERYLRTREAHVVGTNREVTGLRKNGTEFPMDLAVGEAILGHEHVFTGMVRDITERKEAEEKLADAYNIISSSIDYATHIQRSVLPHSDSFSNVFSDHFVIWEPRDRVGGDIYWNRTWGDGVLVMLADCTGHGVPGAFMTLIATGALDRAQEEVPAGEVGRLVQRMHQLVQLILGQHTTGGTSDDGLELGACYLTPDLERIDYVGARFSLFVLKDGEVNEIEGDRKGIGYRGIPQDQNYNVHILQLEPRTSFYMSSDGLIDQVGGERRRMFGKKRFMALLEEILAKPMSEQKDAIQNALSAYQGEGSRRDDVSVIGFRVG